MGEHSHATDAGPVAVQLLDPASGRPIKSWSFNRDAQITIGRAPDQDVEISDPYVSRNHANLECRDGQWRLVSLGRYGVIVDNQSISEFPVNGEVSFRLGAEGPMLRFRTTCEQSDDLATMIVDTVPAPVFHLDERRLRSEVDQIANGDYFQKLQQTANELRHKRKAH
jgi:hypothetical protein